jgi:hypothetical protein
MEALEDYVVEVLRQCYINDKETALYITSMPLRMFALVSPALPARWWPSLDPSPLPFPPLCSAAYSLTHRVLRSMTRKPGTMISRALL